MPVRVRPRAPRYRANSLMVKQPTHNRSSLGSIPSWPTKYMYCTKLKNKFPILGYQQFEEVLSYQDIITYSNVFVPNTFELFSIIPKQYRDKFSLSLMKVSGQVPPHVDSGSKSVVNFYIKTDNCTTQFYKKDSSAVVLEFSGHGQEKGALYDVTKLEATESFVATPTEAWLLNVNEPHAVWNNKEKIDRVAISLSSDIPYADVKKMLEETRNL